MKKNYRRYNYKSRDKNSRFTKKQKMDIFLVILPIFISVCGSVFISYKANNVQIEISKNNRLTQTEINKLKKEELELNKSNSFPAFTFSSKEQNDNVIYTLKKEKGEMNNVNFSVFEIISGVGTYNDKPLSINQKVGFSQSEELDNLQASYPAIFDIQEVNQILNSLLSEEKIDASVEFLFLQRFYHVSYMNFEHDFKDEYYKIGKNGIGQSVESPYNNGYSNLNSYKADGGFSGRYDETLNNEWLANKLFEAVKNSIYYQ